MPLILPSDQINLIKKAERDLSNTLKSPIFRNKMRVKFRPSYLESLGERNYFDTEREVAGAQDVHYSPVFYSNIFVLLV
jgi:hypothetical protein